VPDALRRDFDSATLLTTWMIWKERNRRTFDEITSTPAQLLCKIKDEAADWVASGFRDSTIFVTV